MTIGDVQRAYLAIFAAREAGLNASADQMKAIAMCIRNRVRQGWENGDWIRVMERSCDTRANLGRPLAEIDVSDRDFQIMARDVDEIYFSRRDWQKEPSRQSMPDLDEAIGNAVFWGFIDYPFTTWFTEKVIKDQKNHPQKSGMGVMLFYE